MRVSCALLSFSKTHPAVPGVIGYVARFRRFVVGPFCVQSASRKQRRPKRLSPDIASTAGIWPGGAATNYPVVAGIRVLQLCFRPVPRRNADPIAILSVAPNITALASSSGRPYRNSQCQRDHDCCDENFQRRFRSHCCILPPLARLGRLFRRPDYGLAASLSRALNSVGAILTLDSLSS
jgi:hypothetical protein